MANEAHWTTNRALRLDEVPTTLKTLPDETMRLMRQLDLSDASTDRQRGAINDKVKGDCGCAAGRNLINGPDRATNPDDPQVSDTDAAALLLLKETVFTRDHPEWHETVCPHHEWSCMFSSVDESQATLQTLLDLKKSMKSTYDTLCRRGRQDILGSSSVVEDYKEPCCCDTDRLVGELWMGHMQRELESQAGSIVRMINDKRNEEALVQQLNGMHLQTETEADSSRARTSASSHWLLTTTDVPKWISV